MKCAWIIPKLCPQPWYVEKLSSMKPVLSAKKVEESCSIQYYLLRDFIFKYLFSIYLFIIFYSVLYNIIIFKLRIH